MPLSNIMDWDKLRIFHAVADAGSFTHAGHELGLSQSAVSRQISALEDDLNVPLFHRHARGLILTEQGEMLYRTAHDVFTKLTAAQDPADGLEGEALGRIAHHHDRGPRLRLAHAAHQGVHGTLSGHPGASCCSMTASWTSPCARPTWPSACAAHPADLIQRKLFTVHHHVYASVDYMKKHGIPKSVEDLDKHKILIFGTSATYLNNLTMAANGRPLRG
jgi:DNA-binding transcriptional LysR family regulator